MDAAGDEPGQRVVIEGTLDALRESRESGTKLVPVLYGPAEELERTLHEAGAPGGKLHIVDAPDVIAMDDRPSDVLKTKPNSSILRAVNDLAGGKVDAFVSMGNTGAVVGTSRVLLGRIRWIGRPALGIPLPQAKGMSFLIDAGASIEVKAKHLVQFAAMGSVFVEKVYGIAEPRVGLLNIGAEENKGTEREQDAYRMLSRSPLRFIGNIEGNDLFANRADVIVTSGFVGNILLKFIESIPRLVISRLGDAGLFDLLQSKLSDMDYRRYGGAILLGVNGVVVVGHGRSQGRAVTRALHWAGKMVKSNMITVLGERVFHVRRALWLSNPFARGESKDDQSA